MHLISETSTEGIFVMKTPDTTPAGTIVNAPPLDQQVNLSTIHMMLIRLGLR